MRMIIGVLICGLCLAGCTAVGVDAVHETRTLVDGTVIRTEWRKIHGESVLTDRSVDKLHFDETDGSDHRVFDVKGYQSSETKALELMQSIMDLLGAYIGKAKPIPTTVP